MIKEKENKGFNNFFDEIQSFLNTKEPLYLIVISILPVLSILTSLEVAVGITAVLFLVTVSSMGIFSLFIKKTDEYVTFILALIITFTETIIISLLVEAFLPNLHNAMGMYIIFIAINMMIMIQLNYLNENKLNKDLMKKTLKNIAKIAIFMISIGFFREIIGTGEIKLGFILPMPFEWIILSRLNLKAFAIPFVLTSAGALFSISFIIIAYKIIHRFKRSA